MANLLEESVDKAALDSSESQYHREVGEGKVTDEVKYAYAKNLVRAVNRVDILKGIKLLEELFYSESDVIVTDCLLHLSIGNGRVGDYRRALYFVRLLIQVEPSNRAGRDLEAELRRRLRREGLTGMGIVAGATLVLAVAIASYYIYTRRAR